MSTFWKIFITVIVTILVVGGGTFYIMQRQIDSIRNDNQAKITDLNKQIVDVSKQLADAKKTTAASTTSPDTSAYSGGGVSFQYPSSWVLIQKQGIGEGSGIQELTLTFGIKRSGDQYSNSDLTIVIYPKGSASTQAYNDVYKGITDEISKSNPKTQTVTIAGIQGTKYYDIGGLASNPVAYIVKNGDKEFLTITDEFSEGMLGVAVSQATLDQIISSAKFTN